MLILEDVMTKQKPLRMIGKATGIIAFLAVWFVMLRYSNWYFYNGFDQKNAIMQYCSQFNDLELGWFAYIFKHGVLNFVAGYGAIFPLLVPVIYRPFDKLSVIVEFETLKLTITVDKNLVIDYRDFDVNFAGYDFMMETVEGVVFVNNAVWNYCLWIVNTL